MTMIPKLSVQVYAENGVEQDTSDSINEPGASGNEEDYGNNQYNYAVFSGNLSVPLNLYCWKSFFVGDIYAGGGFNYGGSELYVEGKVDSPKAIKTDGWITEVSEKMSILMISPCRILVRK